MLSKSRAGNKYATMMKNRDHNIVQKIEENVRVRFLRNMSLLRMQPAVTERKEKEATKKKTTARKINDTVPENSQNFLG